MRFAAAFSLAGMVALPATAQDWPHWRGPRYDGSADVEGLPTEFGREKAVRWAAELPGPGAGTPIVVGDRVYVSAADHLGGALVAMCLDRATGKELWAHAAGSGYRPGGAGQPTKLDEGSDYATPSPVASSERVVFFFGNGDLVAYSPTGERQWARNLQEDYGIFCFQWTFSSSPTLFGDRLFLQVLQRDEPVHGRGPEDAESFLLALDPATGETLYRHVRPSAAKRESLESYATPIPLVRDGREEILVVGGDVVTGHDPETGAELWRWGTWNEDHREEWWRVVPTPVSGAGVVLACGPKRAPVVAVRAGGKGLLGADSVAWKRDGRANPVTTDVPTPLFYREHFFVLSDLENALSKVDGKSGEVRWTIELPREYPWRSSPTGADGKVWLMDHHGDVLVVDAGNGEILARAAMGGEDDDEVRSSIVAAHGALFVRTNDRLACLAAAEAD